MQFFFKFCIVSCCIIERYAINYYTGLKVANPWKRNHLRHTHEHFADISNNKHSVGHKSRLGRHEKMTDHKFGSCDFSQEELVVEMGDAYLCGITGIEHHTIQNSAAYIQNWIRKFRNDNKVLVIAATQAQKAVDYILNHRATSLSPEERTEIQEPAEC